MYKFLVSNGNWLQNSKCPDCHCSSEIKPVCTYDGETYQNECLAECDDKVCFYILQNYW